MADPLWEFVHQDFVSFILFSWSAMEVLGSSFLMMLGALLSFKEEEDAFLHSFQVCCFMHHCCRIELSMKKSLALFRFA